MKDNWITSLNVLEGILGENKYLDSRMWRETLADPFYEDGTNIYYIHIGNKVTAIEIPKGAIKTFVISNKLSGFFYKLQIEKFKEFYKQQQDERNTII